MKGAVGVIGAGYWGKKHVDEYTQLGHKVFVSDLSEENLDYCKEKFDVAGVYKDFEELLKNDEIRYVSVCTPNSTHFKIARAVLESGKHVLVEKPFVMNSEDGKKLISIAKKQNLNIAVGHIFRFNNAIKFVREQLKGGELGEPYLLKLSWTNLEPVFGDRDVLFDLAPHPFDIADFLFEHDPEEISCVGGAYRQMERVESAFINCTIRDTIVNVDVSWITPRKTRELVLVGSKKTIFADCTRQKVSIYDNDKKSYQDVEIVPNNTIQDELRDFIYKSDNGGTSVAGAEVGVKIIHLLELVEESLKKKRTIKVSF